MVVITIQVFALRAKRVPMSELSCLVVAVVAVAVAVVEALPSRASSSANSIEVAQIFD